MTKKSTCNTLYVMSLVTQISQNSKARHSTLVSSSPCCNSSVWVVVNVKQT